MFELALLKHYNEILDSNKTENWKWKLILALYFL